MTRVLAAAVEYDIPGLKDWSLPRVNAEDAMADYQQFRSEAARVVVQLQIRVAKRKKKYSVFVDVATKKKLRQLLEQMRKVVDESELALGKRERLYERIHDLQEEIDRDRTRLERYGALVADVMNLAKECEPLVRIVERMGATFGSSKQEEDEKRLPGPTDKRRIEPPKVQGQTAKSKKSSFDNDLDEEIPF